MQHGLPSDYVLSIFFDRDGIMWVGTDKGACRFSGGAVEVINLSQGLYDNAVYDFVQLSNGSIWMGTGNGIAQVEIENGRLLCRSILHKGERLVKFWKDAKGSVYMLHTSRQESKYYSISRLSSDMQSRKQLCSLKGPGDAAVNSMGEIVALDDDQPVLSSSNGVNSQPSESAGKPVAVQSGNGHTAIIYRDLFRVTSDADSTIHYTAKLPAGMNANSYTKLHFTSNYHILYRTTGGVAIYSPTGGLLQKLESTHSLVGLAAFCVGVDSSGVVYASDFGRGMIAGANNYLSTYSVGSNVLRLLEDGNTMYANSSNTAFAFFNGQAQPLAMPATLKNLHFLSIGLNKELWFFDFNKVTGKSYSYEAKSDNDFSDFSGSVTKGDTVYMSSYSHGLSQKIVGRSLQVLHSANLKALGAINRIALFGDTLLLYSLSGGLAAMDLSNYAVSHFTFPNALISKTVHDAWLDADTIWVATDGGVSKIYKNRVLKFGKGQGFVGERALNVFKDAAQRTWVLSNKMLHLVLNNKLYALRSRPVLLENELYITTARFQKATNRLFVGTNNSVEQIAMGEVSPSNEVQTFGVTKVWMGDSMMTIDKAVLQIPSNHEELTMQLSFPGYSFLNQSERFFKLDGYHTAWQPLVDNQIKLNRLPPGSYQLNFRTVGPDFGNWTGIGIKKIVVVPPFYQRSWFLVTMMLLAGGTFVLIWRRRLQRRFQQRENLLNAKASLHAERGRISRELHDNVGSMLTLIINKLEDEQPEESSKPIVKVARETLGQLRETIWALDKPVISLAEWRTKAGDYLQTLASTGVPVQHHFNVDNPGYIISPTVGLNLFRIMQEACTNAIKHSEATNITVNLDAHAGLLTLSVSDDGRGFNTNNSVRGFGLRNMAKRAADIHAEIEIESRPDSGTTIIVSTKAQPANTPNG